MAAFKQPLSEELLNLAKAHGVEEPTTTFVLFGHEAALECFQYLLHHVLLPQHLNLPVQVLQKSPDGSDQVEVALCKRQPQSTHELLQQRDCNEADVVAVVEELVASASNADASTTLIRITLPHQNYQNWPNIRFLLVPGQDNELIRDYMENEPNAVPVLVRKCGSLAIANDHAFAVLHSVPKDISRRAMIILARAHDLREHGVKQEAECVQEYQDDNTDIAGQAPQAVFISCEMDRSRSGSAAFAASEEQTKYVRESLGNYSYSCTREAALELMVNAHISTLFQLVSSCGGHRHLKEESFASHLTHALVAGAVEYLTRLKNKNSRFFVNPADVQTRSDGASEWLLKAFAEACGRTNPANFPTVGARMAALGVPTGMVRSQLLSVIKDRTTAIIKEHAPQLTKCIEEYVRTAVLRFSEIEKRVIQRASRDSPDNVEANGSVQALMQSATSLHRLLRGSMQNIIAEVSQGFCAGSLASIIEKALSEDASEVKLRRFPFVIEAVRASVLEHTRKRVDNTMAEILGSFEGRFLSNMLDLFSLASNDEKQNCQLIYVHGPPSSPAGLEGRMHIELLFAGLSISIDDLVHECVEDQFLSFSLTEDEKFITERTEILNTIASVFGALEELSKIKAKTVASSTSMRFGAVNITEAFKPAVFNGKLNDDAITTLHGLFSQDTAYTEFSYKVDPEHKLTVQQAALVQSVVSNSKHIRQYTIENLDFNDLDVPYVPVDDDKTEAGNVARVVSILLAPLSETSSITHFRLIKPVIGTHLAALQNAVRNCACLETITIEGVADAEAVRAALMSLKDQHSSLKNVDVK